jgi:hypothetical protein
MLRSAVMSSFNESNIDEIPGAIDSNASIDSAGKYLNQTVSRDINYVMLTIRNPEHSESLWLPLNARSP